MKKLMIALAAVCAAVATQAATFSWGTDGKAYGIAAATVDAGLSKGHYAAASSGNANSMYNLISSYAATWAYEITFTSGENADKISGSLTAGDFDSRAIVVNGLASELIVQTDPVTPVDYSIVITGTITDGLKKKWEIVSDAIVGTYNVPSLGDINLVTAGPTGWTAVPEPTSGLLMLLGMAGLALRRKQK